jgi:RNA 2',3'-cyclic 3'-phosphodiesterase
MVKRLFIALKIEPSKVLSDLLSDMKNQLQGSDIRWVNLNHLHITLMFLGNVESALFSEIEAELDKIATRNAPFNLTLVGLGAFYRNKQASVIWAGIKSSSSIDKLASEVQQSMFKLGFKTEERKFRPHLTLGRIKSQCNERVLKSYLVETREKLIQDTSINKFILFESKLMPMGTIYYQLKTFDLNN